MTICPDGHTATFYDLQAGLENAREAFTEMKAEGSVARDTKLKLPYGLPGISNSDGVNNAINIDPQYPACLNKMETKAVLLHEAGHQHNDWGASAVSSRAVGSLALSAAIILIPMIRLAKFGFLRLQGRTSAKEKWPLVACCVTGLVANQVFAALDSRSCEKAADLYAARALGSSASVEKMLVDVDKIQPGPVAPFPSEESSVERAVGLFKEYVYPGLAGKYDHPTTQERIEALEKHRDEIREGYPLRYREHPVMPCSIAVPSTNVRMSVCSL